MGLPTAIVVAVLGVLAWRTTRAAVEASLQRELQAAVAVAASTINPTVARQVLPEEQQDSRTYRRLVGRLKALQSSTGSVRVMLIDEREAVRADGDGSLRIGDPAPRVALDRVELSRALQGIPSVSVPFTGVDGRRFMAAYALVPEPEGDDRLGEPGPRLVLSMEAPAAALDATDAVARQIAVLVALAVLVVLALAIVVARTITRPLLQLSRSAERLSGGDLKQGLDVPVGDDEVARLGRRLEAMRQALVDRDAERQMMLAGIAHEVRNPLGGMELFSGLLQEGVEELDGDSVGSAVKDELREQARRVRSELSYLTGVVNDFLAFARYTPLQREPVEILALLEDVRSLCARPRAAHIDIDARPGTVFPLDRGRIKQALLNLVDNALAFTDPSGTVTVSARVHDDGTLVFEVKDTGKGMSEATLARVFTPFFTPREKGSGLGLALVRKLARDHGGDATLQSAPGLGTTVTIRVAADPLATHLGSG